MAQYHLPEFDDALKRLQLAVAETVNDIEDFQSALDSADSPELIIKEYESRRLLRFDSETVN